MSAARAVVTLVRLAEPLSYSEAVRSVSVHRPVRLLILSAIAAIPGLLAYGALAWYGYATRPLPFPPPVSFSIMRLLAAVEVLGPLCLWLLLAAVFWAFFLRWRHAAPLATISALLTFLPGFAFFAALAPALEELDEISLFSPPSPSFLSFAAPIVTAAVPLVASIWFLLMGYATATRRLPLRHPRAAWLVSLLGPAAVVAAWSFVAALW